MDSIGRYRIVRELGRGGTGVVYHATDPNIGRPVAIKTIPFAETLGAEERTGLQERLLREARSVGSLSHPAIVTIYDVGQQDGLSYIAMEYVDGPTLKQMLSGPDALSGELMFQLLRQTASALDYAHGKGIVHRDVKPANLMIAADGAAKIADFGVAKAISGANLSASGTITGTPQYMSPEQMQGQPIDGRSDQYSLAVLAYEILTGKTPFEGESLSRVAQRILHEDPPEPHRINPSLSVAIDRVLLTAMAKAADARYDSCRHFVDALETACSASPGWRIVRAAPEAPAWRNASGLAFPMAPPPQAAKTPSPADASQAPSPASFASDPQPVERAVASKRRRWPFLLALLIPGALAALVFWHPESAPAPPEVAPAPSAAQTQPGPAPAPAQTPESARPSPFQTPGEDGLKPVDTAPPPIPAVRPRPARDAPKPQEVRVSSNPPGATAELDRGPLCTTPCSFTVAPGRHQLTLQLAGYEIELREFNVTGEAAPPQAVYLRPQFGTLLTKLPAGARLFVNGQPYSGASSTLKLAPGTYQVAAEMDGQRIEQTVEIKKDQIALFGVH